MYFGIAELDVVIKLVGVPLIAQVVESILNPLGKVGLAVQLVTTPAKNGV
jgi:hypothetical protein